MPLSKVKSTRQQKRLEARQRDFDNLSSDKKRANGGAFTRPESNRK